MASFVRIDTANKEKCCGCGACVVACPSACIRMQPDEEGFDYPIIDVSACVDCGKCLACCGMQNPQNLHPVEAAYAAWHTDDAVRREGTSGSAFAAIADTVFRSHGAVAGAMFCDGFHAVKHVVVETIQALQALHGSKYVQSETADCFRAMGARLHAGQIVFFSGTPCQVGSVRRLAEHWHATDRLITCDIVCHGVPSPKVFRNYVTELERTQESKIVDYSFRDKKLGWNFPRVRIAYANGVATRRIPWADAYFWGYSINAFLRPCCYVCPYATAQRAGDLTLADCWRVAASHPQYDDNQGTSLVLENTAKGRELLRETQTRNLLFMGQYDFRLACERNTPLRQSSPEPSVRKRFFDVLRDTGSFSKAATLYMNRRFLLQKQAERVVKYFFWPLLRRLQ
ncbi:MAG: hypothetical protein FJ222_11130 [Lentisphaerae bacterium]|nr:hypothetical protein [Lentisphaerota bacterium]